MPDFEKQWQLLNAAQRTAVEAIEGPVMVVAGPGTGKTQVVAMRVANILRKTQIRPGNILCLTFSVSGATAMRERLRAYIGADAYGVTISTIHGFCASIIDRHPVAFSDWAARQQLSDVQRYQLLQGVIDAVSPGALINPKDPYGRIPDILSRISDCKREGKTLADLRRVADEYEKVMAGKSRKGTKQHEKNLLAARKFRELVDIFDQYAQALTARGAYDYDDMILVVLQALAEEEWMLLSMQERYQYILVDEAQDLNGAQWRVIERLTTYDAVPNDPNFLLVGDDDQAIYRFQGANLEHMLDFHARFPQAPVIALTTNYRSTQSILDAAGRLIAHNEERLVGRISGLTKDLIAATKEKGTEPVLLRAVSDAAESWLIADLVEERLKSGIAPEELAVLVQTNAELFPLYDVLRARNIPVILEGKSDLLTHPIVSQAVTILRSLVRMTTSSALLPALACDCFGCHPADIARVVASARERERSSHDTLLELETLSLPLTDSLSLIRARDTLLDLAQKQQIRTVLETVEHVLRECGLTQAVSDKRVASSKDVNRYSLSATRLSLDPLDLAAIEAFFNFAKQRCLDHPSLSLAEFIADLALYADPQFSQVRVTYRLPHLVSAGVRLITAHQSKGLEFHTVILSSFRDGHWDRRRNPSMLSIPEDLLFGWQKDQKSFEKHQDERRVTYVAMTRAKRELLFVCPREFAVGERSRMVSPSAFFAEAGPLAERDGVLKNPSEASLLLLQPTREMDAELRAYLTERIKTFALSPTSLTRFLRDPLEFRRVDLLGQPEAYDEKKILSMGYGTAVHWALKEWAVAQQKGTEFSLQDFLRAFQWNLTERNALTDVQRSRLLSQAEVALPAYFAERLESETPVLHAVERDYRSELGDDAIKGKIDRIDRFSETSADAIVIDYKTGRPKAESEIRGGLEPGKISRTGEGELFRQLVFYALLLELSDPLLVPQVFALDFIGERGEEPIRREFSVTMAEKSDLRKLITAVWTKVKNLDFSQLQDQEQA